MAVKRLDGWSGYSRYEEYYSVDSIEELERLYAKKKEMEYDYKNGMSLRVTKIEPTECGGRSMCFDGFIESGKSYKGVGFDVCECNVSYDKADYYIVLEKKG